MLLFNLTPGYVNYSYNLDIDNSYRIIPNQYCTIEGSIIVINKVSNEIIRERNWYQTNFFTEESLELAIEQFKFNNKLKDILEE